MVSLHNLLSFWHKSARRLGSAAAGCAQALEDTGAPVKRAVEVIRRADLCRVCGTMRLDGSPPPRPMGRNNLLEIHTYVSPCSFTVPDGVRGGRCEKRRSNIISANRFFIISIEPPAIIQPRERRTQYSTSVSCV